MIIISKSWWYMPLTLLWSNSQRWRYHAAIAMRDPPIQGAGFKQVCGHLLLSRESIDVWARSNPYWGMNYLLNQRPMVRLLSMKIVMPGDYGCTWTTPVTQTFHHRLCTSGVPPPSSVALIALVHHPAGSEFPRHGSRVSCFRLSVCASYISYVHYIICV